MFSFKIHAPFKRFLFVPRLSVVSEVGILWTVIITQPSCRCLFAFRGKKKKQDTSARRLIITLVLVKPTHQIRSCYVSDEAARWVRTELFYHNTANDDFTSDGKKIKKGKKKINKLDVYKHFVFHRTTWF